MEAASLVAFSSPKAHVTFTLCNAASSCKISQAFASNFKKQRSNEFSTVKHRVLLLPSRPSLLLPQCFAVAEALEEASVSLPSSSAREMSSKIDKSGRFCSPRAAREHALLILYAACLDGSDPVRLFDKRVNAKRDPDFVFDKASLLEYNHMRFSGPPIEAETEEDAKELILMDEKESANEEEVLSAPPKLVYNKFVLRFTRRILEAVVGRWDRHILAINKIIPLNWKNEPAGRILELCILHLAMAEITEMETRHQIVINEAVDLTKRFCDGTAPRVINGCLRTFIKDHSGRELAHALEAKLLTAKRFAARNG